MIETKLLSSLHKAYPDAIPATDYSGGTVLCNEPFSFQVTYRCSNDNLPCSFNVQVEAGDLPVSSYRLDYVPLIFARGKRPNAGEERTAPGLYPDPLIPRQTNPVRMNDGFWAPQYFEQEERALLTASPDAWQSLWFTVNEEGKPLPAGEYKITVRLLDCGDNATIGEETLSLRLLPAQLPEQTLLCTNWLHCDCIADMHDTGMFDDRFFEVLESYVHTATLGGQNMFMLPAFTPPLDTPVGKERRTAQLIGVTIQNGKYSFDFSLMKRYIDVCRRAGATYFEHNHFFTQWGAVAAPKVIATVDGNEKRIFGWDTPATGAPYAHFLREYIPQLRAFLRQEGLEQRVLFHVSDEPQQNMLEDYRAAKEIVRPLLEGCMTGDALSHYEFYEQGLTETPVVATCDIEPFLGKCPSLWCYYTGDSVGDGLSNRLINLPSWRNRILGLQMYRYDVKGFLDWGLNYCYDRLSHGFNDPFNKPNGFEGGTGGHFIVYPGRDRKAYPSLRLKVFGEGIQDMRALQLLEKLTDRATVCALIDRLLGGKVTFHSAVADADAFLAVREAINAEIAARI